MKTYVTCIHRLLLAGAALCIASCSTGVANNTADSQMSAPTPAPKPVGVAPVQQEDEEDEYAAAEVADPLEKLNRGIFWVNDGLYTVIFRPISKGYEKVLPKPVRKGIDNAFDNVKFPVRFVNSAMQGKFKQAGKETGKFFVNTVAGFGGILRESDRIPVLANIPEEDFGQTLAKWGIGHGCYIVLPLFGPSSLRETVGLAGDYAANPVNWGLFWHGSHDWEHDWTFIPPASNTLRSLPGQLATYDDATKDAIDAYLSARSAYVQHRAEATRK
jgi:phospholipid-binding lipoprotein MlaA